MWPEVGSKTCTVHHLQYSTVLHVMHTNTGLRFQKLAAQNRHTALWLQAHGEKNDLFCSNFLKILSGQLISSSSSPVGHQLGLEEANRTISSVKRRQEILTFPNQTLHEDHRD